MIVGSEASALGRHLWLVEVGSCCLGLRTAAPFSLTPPSLPFIPLLPPLLLPPLLSFSPSSPSLLSLSLSPCSDARQRKLAPPWPSTPPAAPPTTSFRTLEGLHLGVDRLLTVGATLGCTLRSVCVLFPWVFLFPGCKCFSGVLKRGEWGGLGTQVCLLLHLFIKLLSLPESCQICLESCRLCPRTARLF